jgi:hypothetical protein
MFSESPSAREPSSVAGMPERRDGCLETRCFDGASGSSSARPSRSHDLPFLSDVELLSVLTTMDASKEPLKVLCLDGGGCRGQGQILLLRHLFGHLPLECPVDDVKPCDYFDLICGTSSGGIVALMLARLEMTIGEAFKAFEKLTRDVFEKDEVLKAFLDGSEYELERLEEAVGQMLGGQDRMMSPAEEELKSRVSPSHHSWLRLTLF